MNANWLFPLGEAYSGHVPAAVHFEIRRLKLLLRDHCRGPYDETGVRIGLALFVQGTDEIKVMKRTGIRVDSLRDNSIGADIYVHRTDWEVPASAFRKFLWRNAEEGICLCVQKLKKKYAIAIAEDQLREHLSLVRRKFLAVGPRDNDEDLATKNQETPVVAPEDEDHNRHQIVVQYTLAHSSSAKDLQKRHSIEQLLDASLEEADLGYCDGGDFGSGTMNVFCVVKPRHNAAKSIIETLRKNDLLKGAVVAEEADGDRKVIWPPDFKGEFHLLNR